MKYGQKCGGQNRKIGLTFFPQTKSFLTILRLLAILRIKKPFKKKPFWPENDVFSKNLFYSKLIRDQNYMMCSCQKIHFKIKLRDCNFHQILPTNTLMDGSKRIGNFSTVNIVMCFVYLFTSKSSVQPPIER